MTAFVAFLRAVNIGGRWIKMADLKALFVELGFADVATYVQSGNVAFTADGTRAALKAKIEKAIADRFGFHSETILRTGEELRALIAANPYPEMAADDPAHLVVHFTAAPFGKPDHEALAMAWAGPEKWQPVHDELVITYPTGIGPSKLKLKLKTPTTARNWKSVLALAAMLDAMNSQSAAPKVVSLALESLPSGGHALAKGQMKSNKEKRKPKADKKAKPGAMPMSSASSSPPPKKK